MKYVKDSPLELGFRVWQLRPPVPSLTVVVKGTFDAVAQGPARWAEPQVPATGELYWDDDAECSLRAPSDLTLFKSCGEWFVTGKAWTPGGRPATSVPCSFRLGAAEKSFAVIGDRRWVGELVPAMSEPEPFTEMELRMERAYGGPGYAPNPYGRGREPRGGEVELPNLEQPRDLVRAPSSAPEPVVTGPLPVTWPERARFGGTYDAKYMRERWPWLPSDLDWRFFLEAPPEQRIEGFFAGNERFEAYNLHPTEPAVRSQLPCILPRLFLDWTPPGASEPVFQELSLRLDTVVWDGAIGKLLLTWRGLIEVGTEALDEVRHLFVAHDPLAGPHRSASELQARFEALLRAEEDEEREAEGEPPPSEGSAEEAAAAQDEDAPAEEERAPEPTPEELELEASLAAMQEKLAAAGIKPPSEDAEAPPQPSLPELAERLRASGAMTPELEEMLRELEAPEPEPDAEPEPPTPPSPPVLEGRALVEAAIAEGSPLIDLDLTGADLSSLDLSGRDLSGSILAKANLQGANLSRARLRGCKLAEADLVGANLVGADASGADFTAATLQWADLFEATVEDATFDQAQMKQARLERTQAARASFVEAFLTSAVMTQSDFREADFERATLAKIGAAGACFADATLEDADAEQALFDGALMTKVRASGLRAEAARFRRVDAEDSFWERARLSRADFSGSRLTRADFSDAVLIGASASACSMRGARFDRANAHSLGASTSDLMEACFESADLSYADLRGSNLFAAELWRAKTQHALLEGAELGRTKLEGSAD
jgi:uncharacterized protein YjbI with pentapeptide repeats